MQNSKKNFKRKSINIEALNEKSFQKDPSSESKVSTTSLSKNMTVAKRVSGETKIYGVNACLAVFSKRPQDIIRIYLETSKIKQYTKILKYCADKKIAYKLVTQEDLNKVTETTHHEGICFLARKREIFNFKKFISYSKSQQKNSCIVALENIQNPHNIGAILRVCANFAVDALLLQDPQLAQSGAVFRTAQGGAEWVQLIETGELSRALEELKKQGFKIYGSSSHTGTALAKMKLTHKCVILFGSEADGLSSQLLKICDEILAIPQSGNVESLNVSCAASIILYEHFKQCLLK